MTRGTKKCLECLKKYTGFKKIKWPKTEKGLPEHCITVDDIIDHRYKNLPKEKYELLEAHIIECNQCMEVFIKWNTIFAEADKQPAITEPSAQDKEKCAKLRKKINKIIFGKE